MDTFKRLSVVFPLLGLLLFSGLADAARDPTEPWRDTQSEFERGEFEYDDSQDKAWQEGAVELKSLPADEDLVLLRVDNLPAGLQAHLAASSLSFNPKDRVLRYWLVITSPAGAYNATFEGMRCDTAEYKVYAYGNPRRTPPVQPAPKAAWKAMDADWRSDYRAELMRTLLCNESGRPRQVSEILATARGHAPYRDPSADNADF